MAFLDEIGKTLTKTSQKLTKTSQTVAKKAKDMAETGNLKLQVRDEENQLKEVYMQIGRKYFEWYKDVPEEAMAEDVEKVKEIMAKIDQLKENIAKLDHTRICPNCSAKLPDKGMFCTVCGTRYPEVDEEIILTPSEEEVDDAVEEPEMAEEESSGKTAEKETEE